MPGELERQAMATQLGLWPFTSGLADQDPVAFGVQGITQAPAGLLLLADRDTQIFSPGWVAAVGSPLLVIPAGQPLGVVSEFGADDQGNLWWYLYVDNLSVYVGKLAGAHVYAPFDNAVTYALSGQIPSPVAGLVGAGAGAVGQGLSAFFTGLGPLGIGLLLLGGYVLLKKQ